MALIVGLLRSVPGIAWVVLAVLIWGGVQRHRATTAGRAAGDAKAALATLQADAAMATAQALKTAVLKQQEVIHETQNTAARDHVDAAAAAGAVRRLRARAAHRCAASTPVGIAGGGDTAAADLSVSAELFDGVVALAGQYAVIADERGRAGLACERIGKVSAP